MLDVTVVVMADRRQPTPSLSFACWLQALASTSSITTVAVRINVHLTPDAASESHCPFSLAWAF